MIKKSRTELLELANLSKHYNKTPTLPSVQELEYVLLAYTMLLRDGKIVQSERVEQHIKLIAKYIKLQTMDPSELLIFSVTKVVKSHEELLERIRAQRKDKYCTPKAPKLNKKVEELIEIAA